MDVYTAIDILEIDKTDFYSTNKITLDAVKKKYRKLALQYHPDKNGNSPESTQQFQLIQEAFEVVKREVIENKTFIELEEEPGQKEESFFKDYIGLLQSFLKSILKNENINVDITGETNSTSSSIYSIIQEIIIHGSLQYFEKMSKERSIEVYDFISRHKHVFHISEEVITRMKDIVAEKTKHDFLYVLNPSLDDLLENNIYKLVVNGDIFFVPLWHGEVYFEDKEKNDIIVRCIPELPPHVMIDENNVLHAEFRLPFTVLLLDEPVISISLGRKEYKVPIKFKRIQTVFLSNVGVSLIQEEVSTTHIHVDVDKKAGIYVKITFY